MKKGILVLLIIVTAHAAFAQKIVPATTVESVGFSAERLKRIDVVLNDWVAKGWMNGAVGMVLRDGKIVYHKSVGFNDLETKTALAKDGIFRIASQTKALND